MEVLVFAAEGRSLCKVLPASLCPSIPLFLICETVNPKNRTQERKSLKELILQIEPRKESQYTSGEAAITF